MCINLIKDMNEPLHKLNGPLSPMVALAKYGRETRDLMETKC